eukprot:TRINITY_DN10311_c0_g2_i1.p2 TRINITY_DN10311_c0_g2~~TRINITY_DN10311_c0_g2_i1.p2  ORF type:complete len:388 (+),score=101.86 TRINITY_DN10311_c0_g2_i1:49-1164(+)
MDVEATAAATVVGDGSLPSVARLEAARRLGRLTGAAAADVAVPALVSVLGDEDRELSEAAQEALVSLGADAAAPALATALADDAVNMEALMILGRLGAAAGAAASSAIERELADGGKFGEGSGLLRFLAAAALANVSSESFAEAKTKALAILDAGFGSEDSWPEAMASMRFVPSTAAVQGLASVLRAGAAPPARAENACEAIVCIGPDAAPGLIDTLAACAAAGDGAGAERLVRPLGDLGEAGEMALPILMQMLMSEDVQMRCAALVGLRGLRESAAMALQLLDKILTESDGSNVQEEELIFEALTAIGEAALPVVTRAARDASPGSLRSDLAARARAKLTGAGRPPGALGAAADPHAAALAAAFAAAGIA